MLCRFCQQQLAVDGRLDDAVGPDGSVFCPQQVRSDWHEQYLAAGIDPHQLACHSSACGCETPRVHAPEFAGGVR
jgi:hypothetical protein